jgi:hypothetical protein
VWEISVVHNCLGGRVCVEVDEDEEVDKATVSSVAAFASGDDCKISSEGSRGPMNGWSCYGAISIQVHSHRVPNSQAGGIP